MGGIHLMLLLLLAALVTSLAILDLPDTSKWLNIDCGASLQWSIENNLLIWQTDDKYVDSGTKIVVTESKIPAMPMNTLRYFPQGSKNCYNLPVSGKNKVLLRAGFYYGNYDNISKPPMFDLQFDGNQWATVNASLDEEPIYHEVFYVPQGSSISVCLLRRDGGGVPFISSLELEPFPEDMYKEVAGDVGFYSYRCSCCSSKCLTITGAAHRSPTREEAG